MKILLLKCSENHIENQQVHGKQNIAFQKIAVCHAQVARGSTVSADSGSDDVPQWLGSPCRSTADTVLVAPATEYASQSGSTLTLTDS